MINCISRLIWIQGLSSEERTKRQQRYGRNILAQPKSPPRTSLSLLAINQTNIHYLFSQLFLVILESTELVKWLKELVGWLEILFWIGGVLSIVAFIIDPAKDWTKVIPISPSLSHTHTHAHSLNSLFILYIIIRSSLIN
jgi:hypothetical protein